MECADHHGRWVPFLDGFDRLDPIGNDRRPPVLPHHWAHTATHRRHAESHAHAPPHIHTHHVTRHTQARADNGMGTTVPAHSGWVDVLQIVVCPGVVCDVGEAEVLPLLAAHGELTSTPTLRQTGRQAGRQTGSQTASQPARQTARQPDRQAERVTERGRVEKGGRDRETERERDQQFASLGYLC